MLRGLGVVTVMVVLSVVPGEVRAASSCAGYCGANAGSCWCDDACFNYNDCCSDVRTTCYVPAIGSVTPTHTPTQGAPITIAGVKFGPGGTENCRSRVALSTASADSRECSITSWTETSIRCTVPPGVGTDYALVVRNRWCNEGTSPQRFSYDAPDITGIVPSTVPTTGQVITITGSSFGLDGVLLLDGESVPAASWTHDQLLVDVPEGVGAYHELELEVGGQRSNVETFAYAPPHIDIVSPTDLSNQAPTVITIQGTDFGRSGATVTVGGSPCLVETQGHESITCTAPPQPPGTNAEVRVTAGEQVSNGVAVGFGRPRITAISPASGTTAGGTIITLTGSGFTPQSTVSINGTDCPRTGTPPSNQILCITPEGEGPTEVRVVTNGVVSDPQAWARAAPSLGVITPQGGATAGGTPITITGDSFGASPTATVGGASCLVTQGGHTRIICELPAGQGATADVVVRRQDGTVSQPALYPYAPPSISDITPTTGAASGGTPLTLTGTNFGVSPVVIMGGSLCPVVSRDHTRVTCTTPGGSGDVTVQLLAGDNPPATAQIPFQYEGPGISGVTPQAGATAGGITITIEGTSLGNTALARVGGSTCPIIDVTAARVRCVLPAGQGLDQPVVLTDSGGELTAPFPYDYAKPTVTMVEPATGGTAGGTVLTISGSNFGTAGGSVEVGGRACMLSSQTHGEIRCMTPPGEGADVPVVVTVAGQQAAPERFDYRPPDLQVVSPMDVMRTAGGGVITLSGRDFGLSPQVTVGAAPCPITSASHSNILCILPAGEGSVPARVTAGGQQSNELLFFYGPPVISGITPTAGTSGTQPITIIGDNFGLDATVSFGGGECVVTNQTHTEVECYPPAGEGTAPVRVIAGGLPSLPFQASYAAPLLDGVSPDHGPTSGTVITLHGSNFGLAPSVTVGSSECSIQDRTHDTVICSVPVGAGTGLPVRLTVGGQTSGTALFDYDPPAITGVTPVSVPTRGTTITIVGSSFGASAPSVLYGESACPVVSSDHNRILCNAPEGTGAPELVVRVASQSTTFLLPYTPPYLESLTPTEVPAGGNIPLTISGTNFGRGSAQVTVGGQPCPVLTLDHERITCTVPAGAGPAGVQVRVSNQVSNTLPLTYDTPYIEGISPAVVPTRGAVITLTGRNFGASGSVTVDGAACPVLTYATSRVTCTAPEGVGRDNSVLLITATQTSNTALLQRAAPVALSVSPQAIPAAGGIPITIMGQDFGAGSAVVDVNGSTCPVQSVDHEEITCLAPPRPVDAALLRVSVAQQGSNAISVPYALPLVASVTPGQLSELGGAILIEGSGFGPGVVVMVDGVACPIISMRDNEILCRAPAASGASEVTVALGATVSPPVNLPRSGACGGSLAEGDPCDDGNVCTGLGHCENGVCRGAPPEREGEACDNGSFCAGAGVCQSGACVAPAERDTLACDDGNRCTLEDVCTAGECVGSLSDSVPGCCGSDVECGAGSRCENGACVALDPLGTACADGATCASGVCVDGVCCESDCTGVCEQCNRPGQEGFCVAAAPGAPVGTRPSCRGNGVCAGTCDGVRTGCVFPDSQVVCAAPECLGESVVGEGTCNGGGDCVTPSPAPCAPYACAAGGTCFTGCVDNGHCASGFVCVGGFCTRPAEDAGTPDAGEDAGPADASVASDAATSDAASGNDAGTTSDDAGITDAGGAGDAAPDHDAAAETPDAAADDGGEGRDGAVSRDASVDGDAAQPQRDAGARDASDAHDAAAGAGNDGGDDDDSDSSVCACARPVTGVPWLALTLVAAGALVRRRRR
ncbi:MAG: IPT/TIG domain-containing protein [Myxococcota bacterium]